MKKLLLVFSVAIASASVAYAQGTYTEGIDHPRVRHSAKTDKEIRFQNDSLVTVIAKAAKCMGKQVAINADIPADTYGESIRCDDDGASLNRLLGSYGLHADIHDNEMHVVATGNSNPRSGQASVYENRIPSPNPDDADPYWRCRAAAVTSQDIINCGNLDLLAHNPPQPWNGGYYSAGYGYYGYNPIPYARSVRKFGVEEAYGAFKIDGSLPKGETRNVKVCVDGQFRDEATNIRSWTNPSAGLREGNHVIEVRDLARMRAFKEDVHVEPKAVTETFGGNRFKINLYLDRITAEDSYPINGSCPGGGQ